ncbi:MAG: EF-hand domain-containing protein [Geminicoccaceae bacterium]
MNRYPPGDRRPWLAALAALATLSAAPVWAESSPAAEIAGPEYSIEEIAFIAADTDGNSIVDEAEMARDAAHGFATLDKDSDGKLTPEELGPHDAAQFKRVDTDGDGVLTFAEVMANKLRALKEGDTDHDGGLSFDEMVRIVEIELGGAS